MAQRWPGASGACGQGVEPSPAWAGGCRLLRRPPVSRGGARGEKLRMPGPDLSHCHFHPNVGPPPCAPPRPDFSLKGRYKIAVGAGGSWLLVLCPWRACARTRVEGMRHPVRPSCRARRAAKEAKEAPAQPAPEKVKVEVKKFVKIGRPGYKGESGAGRPAAGPSPRPHPSLPQTLLWPSLAAHLVPTCPVGTSPAMAVASMASPLRPPGCRGSS